MVRNFKNGQRGTVLYQENHPVRAKRRSRWRPKAWVLPPKLLIIQNPWRISVSFPHRGLGLYLAYYKLQAKYCIGPIKELVEPKR
jgi:hypothetical protein